MTLKHKTGLEFNFAWIFAIAVGIMILFLAIYAASKAISSNSYESGTISARQIVNLLESSETGIASGIKSSVLSLKDETKIFNKCYDTSLFGRQKISLSNKIFSKWQEESAKIDVPNKYIFSNNIEQGKKIYYFSKPLALPFKISELIFLSSSRYCFINAPEEIEEDASFLMPNYDANCSPDSIKVCFSGSCEIKIQGLCDSNCNNEYDYGVVTKNSKNLYYIGNLMYAAIFSSPEIYECNVKRLMKRAYYQSELLKREGDFLTSRCETNNNGLIQLNILAKAYKSSQDLLIIKSASDDADRQNSAGECRLW